ncbi:MAG: C40 family peptidase [Bacteroidales bacterium]|nr:C40 family peptidase [Bacteroidales bacterium]
MKKLFLFILSLSILISCENKQVEKTELIIQRVKNKYVPDSRDHIFSINIAKNNGKIVLKGYTNYPIVKKAIDSLMKKERVSYEDSIKLLPDNSLAGKTKALVRLSVANLRSQPIIKSELISQALMGDKLNLFMKSGSWYLVQTPDNYYGWMYAPALTQLSGDEIKSWQQSEKLIVTEIYAHVYEKPDISSQKISDIVIGNLLKQISEKDDFYEVELPDGRKAFVKKLSVENYEQWKASRNATPGNIVATAKQFLGVPYMWGGTSAKQLDCSGFTQTVYELNGIQLPRDASQQVKLGIEIDTINHFSHLQKGDLLFFGKKATKNTKEKVIHVTIYIGDTEFIHAAGLVKINSLDPARENFSAYRKGSFLRAKRILTNE